MKRYKWEQLKSIKSTVQDYFGPTEPILLEFDIVPFDYEVKDLSSCKFYISMNFLALCIDDIIEVYNLKQLSFAYIGDEPKFMLWEQWLEQSLNLDVKNFPLIKQVEIPDEFFRFTMSEVLSDGSHMEEKQFTLRKGLSCGKSLQTWAMVETIKILAKDEEDAELHNMIYGNFSSFDSYIFAIGMVIFLVYVLFLVFFSSILPDLIKTSIDSIFIVLCIIFIIWMGVSMHNNTKRYKSVYEKYKSKS